MANLIGKDRGTINYYDVRKDLNKG